MKAQAELDRTSSSTATNAMQLSRVDFAVNYTMHGRTCRGIYLRQEDEIAAANTWKVNVQPSFPDDASSDEKIAFELRVVLKVEQPNSVNVSATGNGKNSPPIVPAEKWLETSSHMLLVNSTKTMSIKVDPTLLPPGHHAACVRAYAERGDGVGAVAHGKPLFEVPVTVVKPVDLALTDHDNINSNNNSNNNSSQLSHSDSVSGPEYNLDKISLGPAERFRRFIVPPLGCTYVNTRICRGYVLCFMFRCLLLLPCSFLLV